MEHKPKRLREFGYHNTPEYVWETAPLVQHGILPRLGGWDEQDPLWKEDYYTWSALQARAAFEQREQKPDSKDPVEELFSGGGSTASDWNQFVGS